MSSHQNPTDIAREAFRQLASRRIPPTPDNYRALYGEISGQPDSGSTFPEEEFRQLADAIRKNAPGQAVLEHKLNEAIDNQDWESVRQTLSEPFSTLESLQHLTWGKLINELFRQWEVKTGVTQGKKREGLDRVLESVTNPRILFSKLEALSHSWGRGKAAADIPLIDPPGADPVEPDVSVTPELSPDEPTDLLPEIREMLAYVLNDCIAPLLADQPDLAEEAEKLGNEVHDAVSLKQLNELRNTLKRFACRLLLAVEDQAELRSSLQKLLRLLVENIGGLLQDDKWLSGQVAVIQEIVARPLSQRALDDAEQRMKEVIFKQRQLQLSLQETKNALKNMISGFVDHLADFTDATSDYHDMIAACAHRVSTAENVGELGAVLEEVIQGTHAIQDNARRSRDELRQKQQQVSDAQTRIDMLERELAETSHLIRHDQLTGVMNRRGLEETLSKEISRTKRHELPLCVSILDLDDFKKLNDTQGHLAGDKALVHLTQVIRDTLRPQDTVARYGGEEFIIIFPETSLENASTAMTRLQRDLTRRFFLFQNQKLLITFSAGVAQLQEGEDRDSIINRADAAMYAAKKAGKNRVTLAEQAE